MGDGKVVPDEFLEQCRLVDVACRLILEKEGDRRDVAGTIECPRCRGTLQYSIQLNGHIHGWCESGTCLRWMQ